MISDLTLVLKAAEFAAHKHRKQKRKGKTQRPYIEHCIEVAHLLAGVGKVEDANVLAAALLHDTVEDTETTREELVRDFGSEVERYVNEVSDDKSFEKQRRKDLQIEHAPHLSPGAKLIKLADKIANVHEIGEDPPTDWDEERRSEYFAWASAVVKAIGPVNDALEERFARALDKATQQA